MLTAGITKHETTLADGRDLVYYDDAETSLPRERSADARHLDPRPATATMRQDPLTGEWISIAAARQNRAFLPPADQDPLAPATPSNPSEVPSNYDVAVFENRSPSFGPDLGALDLHGLALGRTAPSHGRCEVVCFSPEHEGSFGSLSESRARTVIEAWADRTEFLSSLPGVAQVFPFENRGEAIGVTLHHPHGQIYSYPYVTPRTRRLIESIRMFGPDLFESILQFERGSERVVLRGEHWTAYVRLLRGIDALYDTPTPYIAAWHQAPVVDSRADIRLMLQVTSPRRAESKLKYLAGSESAMGAWIGDIPPEQAAQFIREGIARAQ